MAPVGAYFEKLKKTLSSQIQDEEKWAVNMRLLRAAGIFAGSVLLMRNFGDLMAV